MTPHVSGTVFRIFYVALDPFPVWRLHDQHPNVVVNVVGAPTTTHDEEVFFV